MIIFQMNIEGSRSKENMSKKELAGEREMFDFLLKYYVHID